MSVPDAQVGLAGKQAATGSGENTDESASALLAKQVGSDGAINTDNSTSALGAANSGAEGTAQSGGSGTTNVSVPDAQVALAGKDSQTGHDNTISDASSSANAVGDALNHTGAGTAAIDGNAFGGLLDTGAAGTSNAQGGAGNANNAGVGDTQGGALNSNADHRQRPERHRHGQLHWRRRHQRA